MPGSGGRRHDEVVVVTIEVVPAEVGAPVAVLEVAARAVVDEVGDPDGAVVSPGEVEAEVGEGPAAARLVVGPVVVVEVGRVVLVRTPDRTASSVTRRPVWPA